MTLAGEPVLWRGPRCGVGMALVAEWEGAASKIIGRASGASMLTGLACGSCLLGSRKLWLKQGSKVQRPRTTFRGGFLKQIPESGVRSPDLGAWWGGLVRSSGFPESGLRGMVGRPGPESGVRSPESGVQCVRLE